jgi:hypothetical protein
VTVKMIYSNETWDNFRKQFQSARSPTAGHWNPPARRASNQASPLSELASIHKPLLTPKGGAGRYAALDFHNSLLSQKLPHQSRGKRFRRSKWGDANSLAHSMNLVLARRFT